MQNQDPKPGLADRIAQRSLAKREASYAAEVRALLDAGLAVMRRSGTTTRPRVSDIVAEAGLSNEAFYRHFPSKDALIVAILDDGAERLAGYLAHQMAGAEDPEGQIRCWAGGILSQASNDEIASTTLAVLSNAGTIGHPFLLEARTLIQPLAGLLVGPLTRLGDDRPEFDASFLTHGVVGLMTDFLQRGEKPGPREVDRIVGHCVALASDGRSRSGNGRG
jgi:AcrR family transcriptional regulator